VERGAPSVGGDGVGWERLARRATDEALRARARARERVPRYFGGGKGM